MELVSAANVSGGTLRTSDGGLIQVNAGNTATVSGFTLDGQIVANESAFLQLRDTVTNQAGSTIRVAARVVTASIELTISNPLDDAAARGDEQDGEAGENGLGLPLVTELTRAAGVAYRVERGPGQFRTRLVFPAAAD